MSVLRDLNPTQNQISCLEAPMLHLSTVISPQRLLVFSRMEEGDVLCFVDLIHSILKRHFVALLVVGAHSGHSVLKVCQQNGLGSVDHEEGSKASCATLGRPKAPKDQGQLHCPSTAKLRQGRLLI